MDRCVAKPPCKSVNYHKDWQTCQLVDYDITDGKDYVTKQGWMHYDTGRSRLTRIVDKTQNYCLTIYSSNPCNPGSSWYYVKYRSMTHAHCQGIEAYWDFDRSTGVVLHYCSGKILHWSGKYIIANQLSGWPYHVNSYYETYMWRVTSS